MTQAGERVYNFIFSKLVQSSSDIVGIVAYAQYKTQKVEWIQSFERDNERKPYDSEMTAFHTMVNTDHALNGYRLEAKEILDQYTEQAVAEAAENIENYYKSIHQSKLEDIRGSHREAAEEVIEKAKKSGFYSGIGQNIIANVVVIIIGAIAIVVFWSMRYGVLDTLANVFGYVPKSQIREVHK